MSDSANRVDNPCTEQSRSVSKLYPARSLRAGHIGALQQRHDTTSPSLSASLRDALTGAFARRRRNRPITDHRSPITTPTSSGR